MYKPAVSSVIMLSFPGNADLIGTRTADVTEQVTPSMLATLAPATVATAGEAMLDVLVTSGRPQTGT